MAGTEKVNGKGSTGVASEGTWPGIDSRFRLIIVAGLRTKQLLHGSKPRVEAHKGRRRNTSIALEEVKRGLVHFTTVIKDKVPIDGSAERPLTRSEKSAGSKENRLQVANL